MGARLLVVLCLSCGGAQVGREPPHGQEPQASVAPETAEADEGPVSFCIDAEPVAGWEPEPLDLQCARVERREGAVAERSGAVNRLLRAARSAQREERFGDAVGAFEQARRAAPEDAGVLGELGWARFAAAQRCDRVLGGDDQDRESCSWTMDQARDELAEAVETAVSDARRGILHYNLGRVLLRMGQVEEAIEALRTSECLRPNETVRAAFAEAWVHRAIRAWEAVEGEDAVYALDVAAQLDPKWRAKADAARAAWTGGLELLSHAPDERAETHPTFEELCEDGPCELVGEWVELGGWALAQLRFEDGVARASHVLVARTARGITVVAELGAEIGDSRRDNGYVEPAQIDPVDEAPFPIASVIFRWGSAYAQDCDWIAEAWTTMLLCAHHEGSVHCFASARLGPEPFESDSMLPTARESMGRCSDYPEPILRDLEISPLREVSFVGAEMVVESEDGRTWCLPMRETFCASDHPPAPCTAE